MQLGYRIRKVREFRGLTQTELAEKVGLPADENGRIRISQYENCARIPRQDMLDKIKEALGVKSHYLDLNQPEPFEFVYNLLDWDEDLGIDIDEKEWENGTSTHSLNFINDLFFDFFEEWRRKKEELKEGKISNDDYTEWRINLNKVLIDD